MNSDVQDEIVSAYFGGPETENSNRYTLGRVPIGVDVFLRFNLLTLQGAATLA